MLRAAPYLLAWFAFLIGVVALSAKFVPVINHAVLFFAAFAPYLSVGGAAASAVVLLVMKRPGWAVVPLVLTVVAVALQFPLFSSATPGTGPTVRVLTVNAMEGAADPAELAGAARERADLLAVQELTTELAGDLGDRLAQDFPFRALNPGTSATGTGIWSRYPIVSSRRLPGYQLGATSATVRVPGAASDAVVLCVHVVGPWPYPIDSWRQEFARLPQSLDEAARAAGSGAAIVTGDFNATRSMAPYRRLLRDGYRDAADLSGAGLAPTYPAGRAIPPLLGIDHILIRNSSASGVHTVRIPGTDHLGLAATVHLG
jgi:endonuclease/exonuclease/phosphatase (EEP) superfamily protein YafD